MWQKFRALIPRYGLIWLLFLILLVLSIYYLWIHRYPFTQNAFIVANTHTVSALVPGYIESIHVRNNQSVKKGQELFTVFRQPYYLIWQRSIHDVDAQKAKVESLKSKLKSAEANVKKNKAEVANAQYLSTQAMVMYQGQAASQTYTEQQLRALLTSQAQQESAQHDSESLKHAVTQAEAELEALTQTRDLNQIYYDWTVVKAQGDGYVTNMLLSPGGYVNAGTPLFGFVSTDEWFLQANFKETELATIKSGQPAKIWFWQYPGKVFNGVVEDIGWGVERRLTNERTAIAEVRKENEWFLLPQRFNVQIRITNPDPEYPFHLGASAFVQIPTPARPLRQFIWQLFQF